MLTIRLQRVGRRNQPMFRIVLAEKHRAASKLAKEILGHYNPRTKEFGLKDESRLKYWIEKRVEISPTVHNLLITKGLLAGQKVKAWKPKKKLVEATVAPTTPATEGETSEQPKPAEETAAPVT